MKVTDLRKGDIIVLNEGVELFWAIETYQCRFEDDKLKKPVMPGDSDFGWSSRRTEQRILKKGIYGREFEDGSATVPLTEFSFNVLSVVLPYQRQWMNRIMFKSSAVYLGSKVDPFDWEGTFKHYRFYADGKICFFPSYMMRHIRKAS